MIRIYKKIKDTPGGFYSWWESDVGIVKKPNSAIKEERTKEISSKKVVNNKLIKTIMTKKLLGILPADKLWGRAIRRGVVVAVLTFVAIVLRNWLIPASPEVWTAILAGILLLVDKTIRELATASN